MPFFILFFLLSWIMWLPLCVPVEVVHPSIFLSKLRSHCGANTSYHRTCVHPGLSNTGLRQSACSPCTCVGGTLTGRTCRNADFLLSAYACTYWTIFVKSTETEKKLLLYWKRSILETTSTAIVCVCIWNHSWQRELHTALKIPINVWQECKMGWSLGPP